MLPVYKFPSPDGPYFVHTASIPTSAGPSAVAWEEKTLMAMWSRNQEQISACGCDHTSLQKQTEEGNTS